MSGHSKFANIKHKKEKNDAAKGKIFTIIGRELAVAVKEGGSDPNNNSRLRDVIAKAESQQYAERYNRTWYQEGCRRTLVLLTMRIIHMKAMVQAALPLS